MMSPVIKEDNLCKKRNKKIRQDPNVKVNLKNRIMNRNVYKSVQPRYKIDVQQYQVSDLRLYKVPCSYNLVEGNFGTWVKYKEESTGMM